MLLCGYFVKWKGSGKTIGNSYGMVSQGKTQLKKPNRAFRDFLKENGVEHTYYESAGIHNWKFWNEYLEPAIAWMVG